MDALTSHLSTGFFSACSGSSRALSSSSSHLSSSFLLRCLHQRPKSAFGPIFLERKPMRSLLPSSSSVLTSSPEVDAETVDFLSQITNQSTTVHVKFVLRKPCLFGQQIFIVGDDPIFGLWDPPNAIPLEWSEGHVWTVELDLPAGKPFQFKFILGGLSGEINWQPGPDRIVQIWETTNTIVVLEDWESADNQKLLEEDLVPKLTEEVSSIENNMSINGTAATDQTKMELTDGKQE